MTKEDKLNFTDKYCPSIWNAINKQRAVHLTVKDIEKVDALLHEIRELLYNGAGIQTAVDTATTNLLNVLKDTLRSVLKQITKENPGLKLSLK